MLPEIKKILYATDLSKNARHAYGYAVQLARQFEAGITILHVLAELPADAAARVINVLGEAKWKELKESSEKQVIDTIKGRIEKFCEETEKEMPECRFVVEQILVKPGNPADEILRQAERENYDIIIMGSHGHTDLAEKMLGSTARRVIRRCRKPVLVIRLPE